MVRAGRRAVGGVCDGNLVQRMAEKLGGNIELAIKRLAEEKRNAREG